MGHKRSRSACDTVSYTMSAEGAGSPGAASDYERCLELVRAEENGRRARRHPRRPVGFHTAPRRSSREADGLLDDIVATGITDDPVRGWRRTTARDGTVRFFQGDFVASGEHLRLAIDGMPARTTTPARSHPGSSPTIRSSSCTCSSGGVGQRGDLAAFDAQVRQARRRAERLPRPHGPFNVAYALTYQAWVLTEVGDFDAAARAPRSSSTRPSGTASTSGRSRAPPTTRSSPPGARWLPARSTTRCCSSRPAGWGARRR